MSPLIEKIDNRTALIGVVRLGYVGLPLVLHYVEVGYRVLVLDIDADKVEKLHRGKPTSSTFRQRPLPRLGRVLRPPHAAGGARGGVGAQRCCNLICAGGGSLRKSECYGVLACAAMIGLHWFNGLPSTPGVIPTPPFDLLAHFAVYGVLTALVWLALSGRLPWLTVAIVAVYGGADELRQGGLPGREGDLADFAADLAATVTVTLALSVLRAKHRLPPWLLDEQ